MRKKHAMTNDADFDKSETMTVPMEGGQELEVARRAEELALGLSFEQDTIDESSKDPITKESGV